MVDRPKIRSWFRRLLGGGIIFAALLGGPAAEAQSIAQSGPEQVSLIELYTSQGCSSCPPADRWLSELKRNPDLWTRVVPLAFHVDYWDYIGWRDRLASPEFGQRQRRYAQEGGARTVYTPGMMLNGKDWRGWARGVLPLAEPAKPGFLSVEHTINGWLVQFRPLDVTVGNLQAHLVFLGFDLTANVTAGENRGRKLTNDFVVLRMGRAPLRLDGAIWSATLRDFHRPPDFKRLAIATWVSKHPRQAPLQAAGGWLDQDL